MIFSHDGLRDSLTYLAAPPYFYENLRRDLSSVHRNKSHLTLIRFQLSPKIAENESLYEAAILAFSEILKAAIRAEDLCARLGRFEFTLIVKARIEIADAMAARVEGGWRNQNFDCHSYLISAKSDESSLEILNRLDCAPIRQ